MINNIITNIVSVHVINFAFNIINYLICIINIYITNFLFYF